MDCLSGMEEKEWLLRLLPDMLSQKGPTAVQQHEIDQLEVEIGSDHTWPIVARIGMLWQRATIQNACGGHRNPVSVNPGVQPVCRRTAHCAEELIETTVDGRVGNGRGGTKPRCPPAIAGAGRRAPGLVFQRVVLAVGAGGGSR